MKNRRFVIYYYIFGNPVYLRVYKDTNVLDWTSSLDKATVFNFVDCLQMKDYLEDCTFRTYDIKEVTDG